MFKCEITSESLLAVVAINKHCNSHPMMILSQEVRQREIGHVQVQDN